MARVLALQSRHFLLGLLLLAQCSVFYGSPPSGQCSSDADCERQPALSGLSCDLDYGVCVSDPTRSAEACESSELCTEKNGDLPSLCRVRGTPCIPLKTSECRWVEGDWKAANALFIGTIGPHTLSQSNGSPVPIPWTSRAMRAVDLGLREWNEQFVGGLPLSRSPLAVVHCDSNSDATRVASVIDHLTRTVRVRGLIAMTDLERNASADRAREVDLPALCAACYERASSAASAGVETWRIQPPLEDQAPLVAWRTSDLEQRIRSQRPSSDGSAIRVGLVWQESLGNQAFVGALLPQLRFNGDLLAVGQSAGNYLERRIPDPRREPVDALGVSGQLIDFQPDIVIAAMDSVVSSVYLLALEQQWPADRRRPFYIVTAQNRELTLLEDLARASDNLHERLSGTSPLISAQVAQNRDGFAARFSNAYAEPPQGAESSYDAFYAAAFTFFATARERQYVRASFAQGLAQLLAGPRVNIEPSSLLSAADSLSEGISIDLVGASSELDWDTSSGGVKADASLWCLSRDAQGQLHIQDDAGVHWSRAGELSGTYACPGNP